MIEFNKKEIFTNEEVREIARRSCTMGAYSAQEVWEVVCRLMGLTMMSFDYGDIPLISGEVNLHALLKFNNLLGKKTDIMDGAGGILNTSEYEK